MRRRLLSQSHAIASNQIATLLLTLVLADLQSSSTN